jgi:hypothetical protein
MVNRPLRVVNSIAPCPCMSGGTNVPTTSVTPMATPTPNEDPQVAHGEAVTDVAHAPHGAEERNLQQQVRESMDA